MNRPILVVEDDQSVREMVEMVLIQFGYDVASADSPEKAIEYLSKGNMPMAIIMDYIFPSDIKPEELVAYVRKNVPLIPMALMTAYAKAEAVAKQMGIENIIRKPMTIEEFIGIVEHLTGVKSKSA